VPGRICGWNGAALKATLVACVLLWCSVLMVVLDIRLVPGLHGSIGPAAAVEVKPEDAHSETLVPGLHGSIGPAAAVEVQLADAHLEKFTSQAPQLEGVGMVEDNSQAGGLMSLIVVPNATPHVYPAKKFYGQEGQDRWIDTVLQGRTGLFVVESGAYNGIDMSNSLYFEATRGWDCLLVEANPYLQERIITAQRKCHLMKGGLSIKDGYSSFPFKLAGPLGGIVSTYSNMQDRRVNGEIRDRKPWMEGGEGSGKLINISCYPLHEVMKALGRRVVDYWSLDTEGSEALIIEHTDFSRIQVGAMTVEHNGDAMHRAAIVKALQKKGLKRVVGGSQDDFFASPQYFKDHGLPFPGAEN